MRTKYSFYLFALILTLETSCYPDESIEAPVKTYPVSTDPLDQFVQTNFQDTYGIAVRYKFVDRYVEPTKRVSPPRREAVQPMLEFLTDFWITPYISVPNGNKFFRDHVPAEVVFIGSGIYNNDGTVTLGTADAGARITLTEVNNVNVNDTQWIIDQLRVIYHEFAHIVHQRYNLPPNFKEISPQGYTSAGSWYNLTDEEALQRGFVTPYATSSADEDFAETVARILFDSQFYETYIEDEPNCSSTACEARNEGRVKLRNKYNSVLTHYKKVTGVDLLEVRTKVQDKLN